MSAPLPSQIGPYEVLELLGAGGMGQVYLGRHPEGDQRVAIKVLSTGLARQVGFVDRFRREIEALEKFTHPGIVRLYDSGIDHESPWFAMEYIDGETLLALLRRERRLPWRTAFDYTAQICRALKVAHDHGVIHRDLKPSNLLVDRQGQMHLTDFGVAQLFDADRLTLTGGVIGTAEYMSPEQAEGKRATKQSDLYSLGILLYVMITGRPPFQGKSTVDVLHKQRFGQYDKARAILPELPLRVDDTINRLLSKDPAKRFPDAYVLLRHIEQVLQRELPQPREGLTLTDGGSPIPSAATTIVPEGDLSPTTHDGHHTDFALDVSGETRVDFVPSGPDAGGPGMGTIMKGMLRAELESQNRQHPLVEWLSSGPILALLLAGLLWGMWRSWPRDPSEEELFARGQQLMAQGEGLNYLQARREAFDPLLARNPERWRSAVQPLLDEVELYEISRKSRLPKRDNTESPPPEPLYDSEPRRLIHWATALRKEGNLIRSRQILTNLRNVLATDPEQSALLQLTDRLLKELEADLGESARGFVRRGVEQVRALRSQGDDHRAWQVLRSLFELYQQDPACLIVIKWCRVELWPDTPVEQIEANVWPESTPGQTAVLQLPPTKPQSTPADASHQADVEVVPQDQPPNRPVPIP
ncbi:MAG: serine/threonine-protein kinase [Planctomycetaceae bacterium]